MTVRPLARGDARASSALHAAALDMEFLARFGPAFLRRYHRAWIDSPHALSLAAVDDGGRIVGVLLGTCHPSEHYREVVRRHGARLAATMVVRALARPRLGADLVATRAWRYVRALGRLARSTIRRRGGGGTRGAPRTCPPALVGEVTHVMVDPEARRAGVGRALMAAAVEAARSAGVDELVLVTPPDLPAVTFYERLGWERAGHLTSRSGEEFLRFRLPLGPAAGSAS